MSESIPPWTQLPCDVCGVEFQASRTEPADPPFICEGCETWKKGYVVGVADGLKDAMELIQNAIERMARSPTPGLEDQLELVIRGMRVAKRAVRHRHILVLQHKTEGTPS